MENENWDKNKTAPFNLGEVDDVRLLIKVKGKHYSIVNNDTCTKEFARELRIGLLSVVLNYHDIVDTSLEDIQISNF